jgi:hypothetical protein
MDNVEYLAPNMAENTKETVNENKYRVEFKKPYKFEGQEYTAIDLSGIEGLTVADLTTADQQFIQSGQIATLNEMALGYACIVAARATGKPIEFFKGLPANEGIKIKGVVTNFFYDMD